ncbi:MAG: 50S ribosomal protein L29 [Flavobacteriales bacterium]|nr:50S ribosomal protein L29 [Flavobacteriales bacterium]
MKQSEIKGLSTADLKSKLEELKGNYASLKLAHGISPIENPLQLRTIRRTVARLSTELATRD